MLKELKPTNHLPWMVIGDFNEVLFSHKKEGGKPRSEHLMTTFRDTMEECNLHDLGFIGDKFTWSNRYEAESCTKERLNRAMATRSWSQLHFIPKIDTLVSSCSDHKPLIAFCKSNQHSKSLGGRLF